MTHDNVNSTPPARIRKLPIPVSQAKDYTGGFIEVRPSNLLKLGQVTLCELV